MGTWMRTWLILVVQEQGSVGARMCIAGSTAECWGV